MNLLAKEASQYQRARMVLQSPKAGSEVRLEPAVTSSLGYEGHQSHCISWTSHVETLKA